MTARPEITTVQADEPSLAVQLEAKGPVIEERPDGGHRRGPWTLDLLERTLFEFRAAGAWDQSRIEIKNGGYYEGPSVRCEVLATLGEQAMPWGWMPSQGDPPPPLPDPVVPKGYDLPLVAWLGNRVVHGVLLLVLVVIAVLEVLA